MARVLIAWELGEAFGHLARCLRLAHGLVARRPGAALALKDVRLLTGKALGRRYRPVRAFWGTGYSPIRQTIEQSLFFIERTFLDGRNTDRTRKTQEPQESPPACLH